MTEDLREINRKISELKGWKEVVGCTAYGVRYPHWHSERDCRRLVPNWIGDEAANAELLEEMPFPSLSHFNGKQGGDPTPFWCCFALNSPCSEHADRKTAIALAWLKWKESNDTGR